MVFKWSEENERKLLILGLGQLSKPGIDAQMIIYNWPDNEKPTKGTAGTRFGQLWRQGQVYDFGAGMRDNRRNPIGGGDPVKTTPSRRASGSSKGANSRKLSANSEQSRIPNTNDSSQSPTNPHKKGNEFWSTLATIGSTGSSGGRNSLNSQILTNGNSAKATSIKKPDPNRAWATATENSHTNAKKRKASNLSDSASTTSSEDELATPTKIINSSSPLLSNTTSRPSLPRRSTSATPSKARYTGADVIDDGTGPDDAAKEIDSGEEWNGDDEEGGKSGKNGSRKGMPSKRVKKGWRERVGWEEEEEDD